MHSLLKGPKKGLSTKITWTQETEETFNCAKVALVESTILAHPNHDAILSIAVDASNTNVVAVLQQFINNSWQPLAFFSKSLQPAEVRYSTFSRELLAIYLTIKHFRYILEGREFTVFTDHRPLCHALFSRSDRYSPRESRQMDYVMQFTSDIRYIKGKDNVVADSLPPKCRNNHNRKITHKLADTQLQDEELKSLKNRSTSLTFRDTLLPSSTKLLTCDFSTNNPHPFYIQTYKTHDILVTP